MIVKEILPSWESSMYGQLSSEKKERNLDNLIAEGVVSAKKDAPQYKMREVALEVRRLGRPLTDEELEKFKK